MISTLTTTTVSAILTGALVDSLALMSLLLLLTFLFQKELASVAGNRFKNLVKVLNVGITPLLVAFVLIVLSKVVEVIQ